MEKTKIGTFLFLSLHILFLFHLNVYSQDPVDNLQTEHLMENNAGDGESDVDLSELTANFEYFADHPLDLNSRDESELRSSGLISEFQIRSLMNHISVNGKLLCAEELQVVDGFDEHFIRQLIPFIKAGKGIDAPNAGFARMIRDGKHQVMFRAQNSFQSKKGFTGNDPAYPGKSLALYTRYRFTYSKKLSWGITAEKDPGEMFFKGNNRNGFDFYSAHIAISNIGPVSRIVLGDFQVGYGQGLTLSTGLSGGKPLDPMMIRKNLSGIKPYTSVNEVFFKRGIALSLTKNNWNLDVFASLRKSDANLTTDTTGEIQFTSFQESGLHRTEAEIKDKNSLTELFYGAHLGYTKRFLQTGLTFHTTRFDKNLVKDIQPYNKFEFQGKVISNAGWDYSWLWRNINFFGEVTVDHQRTIATVNGVIMSLNPRLAVSMLYRDYPVRFQTIYGSALKESGNNFNERGWYYGFNFKPAHKFNISGYCDIFSFRWLKYRINGPSHGWEMMSLISYKHSRKTELYLRIKKSKKMINNDEPEAMIQSPVPLQQFALRFHIGSSVSKSFTSRTRLELCYFDKEDNTEKGYMMFQDIQYHPFGKSWAVNFRYAIFSSDSYDSRLYAYENDVLYAYSIPSFYYNGSRFYVNARIKLKKGFDLWARYAVTVYSNRESIGTGNEEIAGKTKSDWKLQLRYE